MGGKMTGDKGARGISGGEAISRRLDDLAGTIKSDVGSERGLEARLKYLTNSPRGYAAMERAGIDVKPRTLIAWLSGDRDPNKANLGKIEKAYRSLRRQNIARSMKRRLSKNGGTRVEVHPADQSGVKAQHRRNLDRDSIRRIRVRPSEWERLVDAWTAGDIPEMDAIWEGIAKDGIGSEWGAYVMVSGIGFGA